jgi:hypothetical protein
MQMLEYLKLRIMCVLKLIIQGASSIQSMLKLNDLQHCLQFLIIDLIISILLKKSFSLSKILT